MPLVTCLVPNTIDRDREILSVTCASRVYMDPQNIQNIKVEKPTTNAQSYLESIPSPTLLKFVDALDRRMIDLSSMVV